MDGWFKGLVSAACVAVIVAAGWYLYTERQDYLVEQRAEMVRLKEIDRLRDAAKAKMDELAKAAERRNAEAQAALETYCTVRVPSQSTEGLKQLYQQCLNDNRGLIEPADDTQLQLQCRNSLNSSALGEAKRLRDWCRQNNFITYDEQLKAEGVK